MALIDKYSLKEDTNFVGKWTLLTEVSISESLVIESLLKSYQIPVMRKYHGATGYLMIIFPLPELQVSLYVPENLYEVSLSIISSENNVQEKETIETQEEKKLKKLKHKKRRISLFFLLLLYLFG
jgi:hypothetical protein